MRALIISILVLSSLAAHADPVVERPAPDRSANPKTENAPALLVAAPAPPSADQLASRGTAMLAVGALFGAVGLGLAASSLAMNLQDFGSAIGSLADDKPSVPHRLALLFGTLGGSLAALALAAPLLAIGGRDLRAAARPRRVQLVPMTAPGTAGLQLSGAF